MPSTTSSMVRYRTTAPLNLIEKWLESNCTDWDLSINGLSDDLRVKELLITFTSESDKERFKDAVGARRFATPLS